MPLLAWICPIKRLIPRESAVDLIIRHIQIRFFQENTNCLTLLTFPYLDSCSKQTEINGKKPANCSTLITQPQISVHCKKAGQTNILENERFLFCKRRKRLTIAGIANMKLSNN